MSVTHKLKNLLLETSHLPIRVLGKTGLNVFPIGLGGQALLEQEGKEKEARELIDTAIDLGVNYFDTATIYGPSRKYLGDALSGRRDGKVIASKIWSRNRKKAQDELEEAFKLLKTDYIDIMQLHNIENEKDKSVLDERHGALEILLEAKRDGRIGFVGVTGHFDEDILSEFVDTEYFDTLLCPVNPAVPQFDAAIKKAREKEMGIIGMKVMSRGLLPKTIPVENLIHYAISRCDVAIIGCSNPEVLKENIEAAGSFTGESPEIKIEDEEASFFYKTAEDKPWLDTYQPKFPELQYEKE